MTAASRPSTVALILLVAAAGCAVVTETWRKPGATEAERPAAQRECEAQDAITRAEPAKGFTFSRP